MVVLEAELLVLENALWLVHRPLDLLTQVDQQIGFGLLPDLEGRLIVRDLAGLAEVLQRAWLLLLFLTLIFAFLLFFYFLVNSLSEKVQYVHLLEIVVFHQEIS